MCSHFTIFNPDFLNRRLHPVDMRLLPELASPLEPRLRLGHINKFPPKQSRVQNTITLFSETSTLGHEIRGDGLGWLVDPGGLFFGHRRSHSGSHGIQLRFIHVVWHAKILWSADCSILNSDFQRGSFPNSHRSKTKISPNSRATDSAPRAGPLEGPMGGRR